MRQIKRCKHNIFSNKKVLLRERKRHTARRVLSTPSVVLTGYPPPHPGRGVPYMGTPPAGYPQPGYPSPRLDLAGYPPAGPGRVPPPGWTWQGTPPPPAGPGRVPPQVSAPWHSGKCCKALWDMGTPPGVNKLTK